MKQLLSAHDVMDVLQVGETSAYQIIRDLNKELQEAGYLTVRGKVNRKYFYERFKLEGGEE